MELKENTQLSNGKYRISRFLSIFPNYLMYEAVDTHTGSPVFIMEFFMRKYCIREEGTQIVKVKKSDIQRFKDKQAQFLSESNSNKDLESTFKEKGTAYKVFKIRSERNREEEYVQVDGDNYRPRHSAPQQKYNNQETHKEKTKADGRKRNPLTNLILYLSPIVVAICLLGFIYYFFKSTKSLFESYTLEGGVGIVLSIAFLILNHKLIRWKQSGFYWLIPTAFLALLPVAWNSIGDFMFGTIMTAVAIPTYFLILKLPKAGSNTWKQCKQASRTTKLLAKTTVLIWIFSCTILPFAVGHFADFNNNRYTHGLACMQAHLSGSSYACSQYAEEMAFSKDYRGNFSDIQIWFEKGFRKAKSDPLHSYLSSSAAAFIVFSLENNNEDWAKEVYEWYCYNNYNVRTRLDEQLSDSTHPLWGDDVHLFESQVAELKAMEIEIKKTEPSTNKATNTSSTYQDDTYTDDSYTDDSYSSDDEEEDNNGLIATGTYTIGDGQSFSVNEPIPYVGNTVVQVEFYEDYIMVDGDYYELVDGSGTRKEYSNGVGFRCYVSENYDMYLESTFNSPMGSMITTYPMTKGSWSHVQRTPHHTSTPSYDTDTDGRIHKPCRVCNMTGKCRPCKGTGRTKTRRVYTLDGYDLRYEDCHTCKGTGICIGCGGDGYIDNEDI